MAWIDKYWDILNNLYWMPRYLGLKSISRDKWRMDGDRISVPRELVQISNGPLYFRERKFDDLKSYLHEQEEILNHLFDLTFSIAADDVINQMLCRPLGFEDAGPFDSMGREVGRRYGWRHQENVTQQDGFFVSPLSLIGVELKLSSTSWPEQIAKYLALMMWEEQLTGRHDHVGLLFVVPENRVGVHWADVGLADATIDVSFVDRLDLQKLPLRIRELFQENPDAVKAIASRLKLGVISWVGFRDRLKGYSRGLDVSRPGDQTLQKLLGGLCDQINQHRKTGITAEELVPAGNGAD